MTSRFRDKWETIGGCVLKLRQGDRVLVITVSPTGNGKWAAIAIESTAHADGIDAVTTDHAHRALGIHLGLRAALNAAERFAGLWRPGELETCDCPDITGPA